VDIGRLALVVEQKAIYVVILPSGVQLGEILGVVVMARAVVGIFGVKVILVRTVPESRLIG
jgi:hypothetical protein